MSLIIGFSILIVILAIWAIGLTTYESGKLGEYMIQWSCGDEMKMEVLASFGLGHVKATYRELVNTVLESVREKKYTSMTMKK